MCPFQEEQELLEHQHLMKIFWNHYHLSVLSVSLRLSCLKAQRKRKAYTYPHTCIHEHTPHICTHISGAFAQLILKNYTSNRLREEDNKINVWLLPQ